MTLTEYLDGMRAATSADELEAAIQSPFKHRCSGPTWTRICKVRIEAGERICRANPSGRFVPHFGAGRAITVCDQTYKVGRGGNSTGVRYCWHYAEQWAKGVLRQGGFSRRAAAIIWDGALSYPHRSLRAVEEALAGKHPDPRMDRLIFTGNSQFGPVSANRRIEATGRAHRNCRCGGWLWDWGAGSSSDIDFINWRCDSCPRTYTEYLSPGRLVQIRTRPAAA